MKPFLDHLSDADLLALEGDIDQLERATARESLAVYAGLHIPAEVERDDLPRLQTRPLAERYIPAAHHRLICDLLERVETGEIKRLLITAPPGSAKSTYCSVLLPAWYLGKHPQHCVIQASHTSDLASRFGRRARNTVASDVHQQVFGSGVAKDSRAAGEWETEAGGEYFAVGVGGAATGRRGDLVVLDDLIRGRADADSKTVKDATWEWYRADLRTRMKPDARLVYITTRWSEDDPAGRILPPSSIGKTGWVTARDGEQWYVLTLCAVIETEFQRANDPLKRNLGDILWPQWFTRAMLDQERESQGPRNWAALYQGSPRPDGGSILKPEWWRAWESPELPKIEFIVQVYDTAFEEGEENAYSARTTWGIFRHTDTLERGGEPGKPLHSYTKLRACVLLLDAWRDKVEFPELKAEAMRAYAERIKLGGVDRVLVERKASGHSLIHELRRAGLPAREANPKWVSRSKRARGYAAQIPLEDGCVFYPCVKDRKTGLWRPYSWVTPVIDECASYPDGEYNDTGDTVAHTLIWLRHHYHLELTDEEDEEDESRYKRKDERRVM